MNVLLFPNLEKKNGLDCTKAAIQTLLRLGCVPMVNHSFQEILGDTGVELGTFGKLLAASDVIMPIGGDGTIMRAARYVATSGKPILAVNAGRVGFLTQVEMHEMDRLERLVSGAYTIQSRMMIEALLEQGGGRRYVGLNDIVISRGDFDKIVDIEVRETDTLIARHRADGVIFSTPTGSTAYSLSAGGPIVDPTMSLLLMTTICTHSTFNRSMVLPTNHEYVVTDRSANNPKGLTVSVDGRRVGKIRNGTRLVIRKSKQVTRLIDLGFRSFYERVNEKLSWGRE